MITFSFLHSITNSILQVLDFGAYRDGTPAHKLGQRIVVDENGEEISDDAKPPVEEEVSDS